MPAPGLFVYSNTATSIDGKINTVAQDRLALGSHEDKRVMHLLRAQADAILVGGNTFRRWGLPLVEDPRLVPEAPPRRRPVINTVLTRRGILDMDRRRFPDPRVELLVLGGPQLDAAAHQRDLGAAVLRRDAPDVAWALSVLAARGCRRVLVEGGGDLIAQLLEAGLLDEIFLTLCPLVVGGVRAPTAVDGPGFPGAALPRLKLLDLRRVEDELFLRYAVTRSR